MLLSDCGKNNSHKNSAVILCQNEWRCYVQFWQSNTARFSITHFSPKPHSHEMFHYGYTKRVSFFVCLFFLINFPRSLQAHNIQVHCGKSDPAVYVRTRHKVNKCRVKEPFLQDGVKRAICRMHCLHSWPPNPEKVPRGWYHSVICSGPVLAAKILVSSKAFIPCSFTTISAERNYKWGFCLFSVIALSY